MKIKMSLMYLSFIAVCQVTIPMNHHPPGESKRSQGDSSTFSPVLARAILLGEFHQDAKSQIKSLSTPIHRRKNVIYIRLSTLVGRIRLAD